MAVLLFKLSNVPEDEAADVRQLVEEHGFHTYDTQAGFWGLGVAAIWLINPEQLPDARAVIDAYQAERAIRQRERHAEQKAQGEAPTLGQKFADNPGRFMVMVTGIVLVLGISTLPMWWLISR